MRTRLSGFRVENASRVTALNHGANKSNRAKLNHHPNDASLGEMNLITISLLLTLGVPQWTLQTSGVTARLRGVSAVSDRVAWASGSGSTVLRTADGGTTWQKITVTTEVLDFRDIDAIDETTAYVLSIGNGAASRIYKTIDSGATWTLQIRNEDAKAFLDAMSFWDEIMASS